MAARLTKALLAAAAATLAPAVAFAHTGVGDTSGFVHGFGHPSSGLDHILAMVMVGVFAWQLGGRALWLVPMTFVAIMAVGGGLGLLGIGVPFVEVGIALSVVVLGAIVALNVETSVAAAMGLVGVFAIFHGHAHGTEIPENAGGAGYAVGFMVATALLHAAGIALGFLIGRAGQHYGRLAVRMAGGFATVAGFGLFAGML